MDKVFKKFDILGINISVITMKDACAFVESVIADDKKSYICVCPVSTVMECRKNQKAWTAVNSSSLTTPDGMPVVWMGRIKGYRNIKRVYGPDLMWEICRVSEKEGYKNYFYGSTPLVLKKLEDKLKSAFPNLNILGAYPPPFRPLTEEEDKEIIRNINNSHADIVWIGLGSPKQDVWMYEHRNSINAPVMIGVGAAFDFLSGTKPQAPKWMRNNGFEWLFRLITEPKRLWRRYMVNNCLFLYYIAKEMVFESLYRRKKNAGGPI